MWPIPEFSNELVTIIFHHDSLILSWLHPIKNSSSFFQLNAYQNIKLNALDFQHGIINNPSNIKKYITQFLSINAIKHPIVCIALTEPAIFEQFIYTQQVMPTKNEFNELKDAFKSDALIIESIYLHARENKSTFYTCAIKPEQLLQFQSFAIAAQLNLTKITTHNAACLQLYLYLKGNHFLHTQLELDLEKTQNNIQSLINTTQLYSYLKIKSPHKINIEDESSNLKISLGLALSHFV